MLVALRCAKCDASEPVFRSLGRITEKEGRCPRCSEHREVELTHSVLGDEPYLDRTFDEMGVPPFDIILARNGDRERAYAFAGDRQRALGVLAEGT